MSDLSRSTRHLLAAAREGLGPDPDVAARVRARVAAAVAGGAAACIGAVTSPPPVVPAPAAPVKMPAPPSAARIVTGASSPSRTIPALAAGGVALVAIVVAIGMAIGSQSRGTGEPSSRTASSSSTPSIASGATPVVASPSARSPASPASAAEPVAYPTVPAVTVGAASTAPVPHRVAPRPSLARETELVDAAMHALRGGDATSAVRVMDTYERETHGAGQLTEEASALAIEARCALGRDVGDRLARFERAWPSSTQRRHIAAACGKRP